MAKRKHEVMPLPSQVTCSLVVKIGDRHVSRSTAGEAQFVLTTSQPFDFFRQQVTFFAANDIAKQFAEKNKDSKQKPTIDVPEAIEVYLKPHVSSTQSKFVLLSSENFHDSIERAWTTAQTKRSSSGGDFKLEVFTYVDKKTSNGKQIQRATATRVNVLAQQIQQHPDRPGPSATQYMAVHLARQVNPPDLTELPSNPTIRQLHHIDRETAAIDSEDSSQQRASDGQYRQISFLTNGVRVPCFFDVHELRAALGLPAFDLCPPYRSPINMTQQPENVIDTDHVGVEEEGDTSIHCL
ncbi:hypothetical protein AC1031_012336 [Aphanomyces cochlioides]|nr:hypothetical protein AC1031_012336 [Aphanomyces cochlioides]